MKKYLSTAKANYRPTWRKKRRVWAVASVLLISLGLLFPWLFSQFSAIVVYPFHTISSWVKNSDDVIPVYFRSRSELSAEIEKLKAEKATQDSTELSVRKLREENMQLRAMVDAPTSSERMVAKVVSQPDGVIYDLLQINRGYADGVIVGSPVYSGLDGVVGLVVHTAKEYSFVELFTSPGFKSTAYVIGPDVFSTLEGVGGGIARVHLPQGISIKPGQLVLLPGVFDGVYGEVVSVENHPTQPEQYGYVAPPVAVNSLYFVSVGKEPVQFKTADDVKDNIRKIVREKAQLNSNILDDIDFEFIDLSASSTASSSALRASSSSSNNVEEL